MPELPIQGHELPSASTINEADSFIISQSNQLKQIPKSKVNFVKPHVNGTYALGQTVLHNGMVLRCNEEGLASTTVNIEQEISTSKWIITGYRSLNTASLSSGILTLDAKNRQINAFQAEINASSVTFVFTNQAGGGTFANFNHYKLVITKVQAGDLTINMPVSFGTNCYNVKKNGVQITSIVVSGPANSKHLIDLYTNFAFLFVDYESGGASSVSTEDIDDRINNLLVFDNRFSKTYDDVNDKYYINLPGGMRLGGSINTNSNYPAAIQGDVYMVLVDGILGGDGGLSVKQKDLMMCVVDSPGGTQAQAGTHWQHIPYYDKSYVDSLSTNVRRLKGNIDCSTNPNYPAGENGDSYVVSVSGKIGGAAGIDVQAGNEIVCKIATGTSAAGDHATVGANWFILSSNILQATTTQAGISKYATATERRAASNNTTLTPYEYNQDKVENGIIKHNFTSNRDPLASDDIIQGFSVGSFWSNNTNGKLFRCKVNFTNTANWEELIITLEVIQDLVAAMFTGGSHNGVSFSYDDINGRLSANAPGGGDMLMSTYDTDNDGKVNSAEDADALGGAAANLYALKTYVDSAISALVNSSPATLDTLNELATALGNDANFATTVTNSLAAKQNIASLAADVRAVILDGLSTATGGAIATTDSILVALGKLQHQISNFSGGSVTFASTTEEEAGATTTKASTPGGRTSWWTAIKGVAQTISAAWTFSVSSVHSYLTASSIVETDINKNLVSVAKGTAYNKSFGTTAGTVAEGNHIHSRPFSTIASAASIILDAESKTTVNAYLETGLTSIAPTYSNFIDGSEFSLHIKKTTASDLILTFPGETNGVSSGLVVQLAGATNSFFSIRVKARFNGVSFDYFLD